MTFLDPITAAHQKEAEGRLPYVFAEEFYVKYKELPDGSQKPEDWVTVTKKGMQNPQRTPMRWRDIERTPMLLQVLKPAYENWKSGQAAPTIGTALDAWMADPGLVKVLNSVNVRSVEDFVEMADHLLVRLNIPGIREKQQRAKAYLDARQSTAKVSSEIAELRSALESRNAEVAELRSLIEQHAIKKDKEIEQSVELPAPVRKRGRPRKIQPT